MTDDQYWNGDVWLAASYRELHRLRTEARNYEMWWQGSYVREAIASVVSGIIPKADKIKYPEKPHRVTPLTEEEKEEEKKEKLEKLISYLDAKGESWSRNNG